MEAEEQSRQGNEKDDEGDRNAIESAIDSFSEVVESEIASYGQKNIEKVADEKMTSLDEESGNQCFAEDEKQWKIDMAIKDGCGQRRSPPLFFNVSKTFSTKSFFRFLEIGSLSLLSRTTSLLSMQDRKDRLTR